MTEPTKPTPEQEALSRFLDELNKGQAPEPEETATKELLETAALLRRANLSVAPPEHLTEAIIREACTQQEKTISAATTASPSKRWSRRWFYSGLVGTAASVLLAVGLHLSPVTAPIDSAVSTPNNTMTAASTPTSQNEQPSIWPAKNDTAAVPAPMTETPAPALERPQSVSAMREQAVPSTPAPAPEKPQMTVSAPQAANFNTASAPIAERNTSVALKSAKYSVAAVLPPESQQECPPLILPGHTPDNVNRDEKTGVITQRFYSNTPQEMLLTQAPLNDTLNNEETVKTDASGLTTLVRIRFQQRITLTGRQGETKLLRLINTLQEK